MTRDLGHRPFGGKIAAQDDQVSIWLDGVIEGSNDRLSFWIWLHLRKVLGERSACDRQAITM